VPWAHLDIAGPARSEEDDGYTPKGGSGFGVRTLVEALATFRKPPKPPKAKAKAKAKG
jgi:leucyl aminopeptidase